MKTSIVNEGLWKLATGEVENKYKYLTSSGYGLITITPDYSHTVQIEDVPIVTGVLLEPFSYSLESDWSPIKTPFDTFVSDTIGDLSSGFGGGSVGAAFTSKLHWKQSGYIKMNPKFRVYDYYGTGLSMIAVYVMMFYVTSVRDTTSTYFKGLLDTISTEMDATFNKSIEDKEDMTFSEKVRQYLYKGAQNYTEGITDILTLRHEPPSVILNIGRVFHHKDMVITDIDFEYSKEYSDAGPLYVDITLSVSSRLIVRSLEDSGVLRESGGNITYGDNEKSLTTFNSSVDMNKIGDTRYMSNQILS